MILNVLLDVSFSHPQLNGTTVSILHELVDFEQEERRIVPFLAVGLDDSQTLLDKVHAGEFLIDLDEFDILVNITRAASDLR